MGKIINYLLDHPNGLFWRATEKATINSRKKKFEMFMSLMTPSKDDRILDVGVGDGFTRGMNFLEQWYPYPKNITALGDNNCGDFKKFKTRFPEVNLVLGDGKSIDFDNNSFDIVFCNAVVEHVGPTENQRTFISELCRVGRKIFLTTPNFWFPIDSHTLLPLIHYFPEKIRYKIYNKVGKDMWADINVLNLLSPKQLIQLFPNEVKVRLIYQGGILSILPHSLICVAEK